MNAIYMRDARSFGLEERPIPEPDADEALVRVDSVAICHTDLLIREGRSPAVTPPLIPGHEFSGTIVKLGSAVRHLQVGDRGAVQTILGCQGCGPCRRGNVMQCEYFSELGLKRDGGFAEYCRLPARNFVRIPDSLPLEDAALTEPLANAVATVQRAALRPMDRVVVIGPGAIGLLALQVARLHSPSVLVLIGTRDERLRIGKAIDRSCEVVNVHHPADLSRLTTDLLSGAGADAVLDCSGTSGGFALALSLVGKRGRIVNEGLVSREDTIPFSPAMLQSNCSFHGVEGWLPSDFQTAADLLACGKVDVKPLVTHRYPLSDWALGFAAAADRSSGAIKVILKPSQGM